LEKLHNEELHYLYSLPKHYNEKFKKVEIWGGGMYHYWELEKYIQVLREAYGKRQPGGPSYRWENIIEAYEYF
jgi:hypothetical protein